jgi:hypothetical protein
MEIQNERLNCKAIILFYFIYLFRIMILFHLLTMTKFALFIYLLTRIRFTIANRNIFTFIYFVIFSFL